MIWYLEKREYFFSQQIRIPFFKTFQLKSRIFISIMPKKLFVSIKAEESNSLALIISQYFVYYAPFYVFMVFHLAFESSVMHCL